MHAVSRTTARTMSDVTAILRNARSSAGLSQADVAKRIDVSRSWISQFERGQTKTIPLNRVLDIAAALGVTVSLDYGNAEEQPAEPVTATELPAPKEPIPHVRSGLEVIPERNIEQEEAEFGLVR